MLVGKRMAGLLFMSIFALSCSHSKNPQSPQNESVTDSQQFEKTMKTFRAELVTLAPYLYSSSRYRDADNHLEILSHLKDLRGEVRSVNHSKNEILKTDPSMAFAMKEMSDLLELGVSSFEEGKKDFSRSQVKKSLGQCFYCHTRSADEEPWIEGGQFTDVAWSSPLDQANFLVALRDFDSARRVLLDALKNNRIPSPLDQETATRKLMAISVRVEQDPQTLLKTVRELEKIAYLPPALKESFSEWKKDIRSWQPTPKSTKGRLNLAEKLIEEDQQRREGDLAGDILLLRASTLLHTELEAEGGNQKGAVRARALYLLGKCYERLVDLGFWELNESYYEACIAEAPHTQQAKKCFDAWEQSITIGYSGSSGTHIPPAVAKKRKALLRMATPN